MDLSAYNGIVALHVAANATWLAVVVVLVIAGTRVRARDDAAAIVRFLGKLGRTSRAVVLPAAILAVLTGGYLAHDAGLALVDHWWLGASIGLWIVAFLGCTMPRGGECARIVRLASESNPTDEDVRWRSRRVLLLARGELLLLAVALTLMLVQPA